MDGLRRLEPFLIEAELLHARTPENRNKTEKDRTKIKRTLINKS
jgi:hypothetical protein